MIPRAEYPRPQFARASWQNLNGEWEYATDRGMSGEARGLQGGEPEKFPERITVPFCRESELSGIGDKDFCAACWYAKTIEIPDAQRGKRVILHVGASDFRTAVFLNGKHVGNHFGGYSSFSFDLTPYLSGTGSDRLVLEVTDDTRSPLQPTGKQCPNFYSNGCHYTRTTGIWQTVDVEFVPDVYLDRVKYYPDIHTGTFTVEAFCSDGADGKSVSAVFGYEGRQVGVGSAVVEKGHALFTVALSEKHLWDLDDPALYDVELSLGEDKVLSYAGLRAIGLKDGIFYLNDRPVFQRLVLDQGFYPDGIYTAPTDAVLERDILLSMKMGFNGARLHQKVFEERFLYYCDKHGYMVWGEQGNWGADLGVATGWSAFLPEWLEVVQRDFNHPALIGWCPLNETAWNTDDRLTRMLADMTRAYDPTRLYIDASGWKHIVGCTDMYDLHCYEQDPEKFKKEWLEPNSRGETEMHYFAPEYPMKRKFTFVSEYGGTWWAPDAKEAGWGYGETPKAPDEVLNRFRGLTEALLFDENLGGLCYTQLTDVEQEKNGLYTFDRQPKFDEEKISAILRQKATIED